MTLPCRSLLFSVSALALAACGHEPPPAITYDDAPMTPAALASEPPKPVEVVEVPTPLPLPGQLQPPPEPAKPDYRPPMARVDAANHAATREPTRDGWIDAVQVYPYTPGALYRVYAAPEQVSDIGLEPGEELIAISAGDTVRWVVGDTTSGAGDAKQAHVLVKPMASGLKTNLVITTDRRTYHLALESTESTSMAAVSWTYPQDRLIALKHQNAQAEAARPVDRGLALDQLRFRYAISGDSPPWRPVRAFDDGSKVYIEFPARIDQGDAPPLPGDLGPAVTHVEQNLGVTPPFGQTFGLRPDPEQDAARAERLRQARLAQEARESKVFFPVSQRMAQAGRDSGAGSGAAAGARTPETVEAASPAKLVLDPERDPNDQQRKLDFLNAKQDDRAIYNPHALQQSASPYEVMAGTVIAASLITGISSDLPGLVTAQVTENVYDTVTGRTLLIPQGARLIGTYDSVVAFGQSRALLVWQRIVMPNGTSVVIDNLPATDSAGYAGLEDQVDYHTWQLLKGVALSTLLGVDAQLATGNSQNSLIQAIRQSATDATNQAGQRIVEKNLNVQPTITVRPGWPLRVIVHRDIVFLRPYQA